MNDKMTDAARRHIFAKAEKEDDPVRRLILRRCADMRLALKQLSLAAGQNETCIEQYTGNRRSPKLLPPMMRQKIASVLDVHPDVLLTRRATELLSAAKPGAPLDLPPYVSANESASRMAEEDDMPPTLLLTGPTQTTSTVASPGRDVPVYAMHDSVAPDRAREYVARPPRLLGVPEAYAVWVDGGTGGRLRPGDLAFVRPGQPPRPGDIVAVQRGKLLVAVGELLRLTSDEATVVDAATEVFPRADVVLHKVVSVSLP